MAEVEAVPSREERTEIERCSLVAGSQPEVWARITTPEGINDEILPVLKMTVPRALRGARIEDLEEGRPVGRSWFLLFGILPIDFDMITLERIEPPRRFREHSWMLTFEDWTHQRTVLPVTDGVSLIWDQVSWVGRGKINRTRPMRAAQRALISVLFAHRHHRLIRHFSGNLRSGSLVHGDEER